MRSVGRREVVGNYYISYIKHIIYIILFLISFQGISQEFADKEYYLIDNLVLEELTEGDKELLNASLKKYHSAKNDVNRIKSLNAICEGLHSEYWIDYQFVIHQELRILLVNETNKKLRDTLFPILGASFNNLGDVYENWGNVNKAKKYLEKSLIIRRQVGDDLAIANSLNSLGSLFERNGNIPKALTIYHEALSIVESENDTIGQGVLLGNNGMLYLYQKDYKKATEYLTTSLKLRRLMGDVSGEAFALHNLGQIHVKLGEHDKAMLFYLKAIDLREKIGDKISLASTIYNVGQIHKDMKRPKKALEWFMKSLEINEGTGTKRGMVFALNSIAAINLSENKFDDAEQMGKKAMVLSKEIGYPKLLRESAHLLYLVHSARNEEMKALQMYKYYVLMKDSMNNEETQKATIRQQTQYEFEKAQIVKENDAKELARLETEATGRRDNIQYSLIFLGILVLFVGIMMLGFIKVSPTIAEGLIFFAFLILFEFVLVFADPYLENYTHGEPMYNLAANALIALLIFPLHAILEKLLKKRIVK